MSEIRKSAYFQMSMFFSPIRSHSSKARGESPFKNFEEEFMKFLRIQSVKIAYNKKIDSRRMLVLRNGV